LTKAAPAAATEEKPQEKIKRGKEGVGDVLESMQICHLIVENSSTCPLCQSTDLVDKFSASS